MKRKPARASFKGSEKVQSGLPQARQELGNGQVREDRLLDDTQARLKRKASPFIQFKARGASKFHVLCICMRSYYFIYYYILHV